MHISGRVRLYNRLLTICNCHHPFFIALPVAIAATVSRYLWCCRDSPSCHFSKSPQALERRNTYASSSTAVQAVTKWESKAIHLGLVCIQSTTYLVAISMPKSPSIPTKDSNIVINEIAGWLPMEPKRLAARSMLRLDVLCGCYASCPPLTPLPFSRSVRSWPDPA